MDHQAPMLTVIVPVHNEEVFLAGLIESLREYLTISYEIIVVDNGSSDRSVNIAEQFGCKIVRIPQKVYPSVARNSGAKIAAANAIAYLDADVTITKDWADKVSILLSTPEFYTAQKIYGRTYLLSSKPSWLERFWFDPLSASKKYINGGNILVSKSVNDSLRGFDEGLETGEDVDYCNRALKNGIAIQFEDLMGVHHEGYPKNLKSFYKRERWHGRGDWTSLKTMINSKIAWVCMAFILAYLVIGFLFFYGLIYGAMPLDIISIALSGVIFVCVMSSLSRFRTFGFKTIAINSVIYFIYFNARINSIFFRS